MFELRKDEEFLKLLVEIRSVLATPYITLNDEAYFVFNAKEAFEELTSEEAFLKPKDFTRIVVGEVSYYIARV